MAAYTKEQIRARAAGQDGSNGAEHRRRTLLERLASFAGSREDVRPQRDPQMAPQMQPRPVQPVAAPAVHSEYAKRPAAPAARPAATAAPRPVQARPAEDEQLEIPAFLRRQSS